MPRNMSFALTQEQIKSKTKTVTRRMNWQCLKVGDIVNAVNKTMGLKKGERPIRLATLKITSIHREKLTKITQEECAKEGFPNYSPWDFVCLFVEANNCKPDVEITRIEFEFVASS